jgi:hypothetical protein
VDRVVVLDNTRSTAMLARFLLTVRRPGKQALSSGTSTRGCNAKKSDSLGRSIQAREKSKKPSFLLGSRNLLRRALAAPVG